MKKSAFLIVIAFLILLCGCTDYREINRGYLVTAIGIDQNGDKYDVLIEAISSSDTSDKKSERVVLWGEGDSPRAAYDDLCLQLVKPLYFEQLGTIILSDNLPVIAEKFSAVNTGVYVAKTHDVKALFDAKTPDGVLGYDVIGLVKIYEKQEGRAMSNRIYNLIRDDFYLPMVYISGDKICIQGDKK